MAAGDPLPDSFPPMGGYFRKPYMEFEYAGELHRVEDVQGGHNGRVASACQARPPQWDEAKKRWVVPVDNNIIDIDLTRDKPSSMTFDPSSRFAQMRIVSNARQRYRSTGLLTCQSADREVRPVYPVDCEFRMFIRVKLPGRPALINTRPFRLVATGIETWPPPVGTRYRNLDDVELFPEFVPFYEAIFNPVVRIRAGDEAVLTDVFTR